MPHSVSEEHAVPCFFEHVPVLTEPLHEYPVAHDEVLQQTPSTHVGALAPHGPAEQGDPGPPPETQAPVLALQTNGDTQPLTRQSVPHAALLH